MIPQYIQLGCDNALFSLFRTKAETQTMLRLRLKLSWKEKDSPETMLQASFIKLYVPTSINFIQHFIYLLPTLCLPKCVTAT